MSFPALRPRINAEPSPFITGEGSHVVLPVAAQRDSVPQKFNLFTSIYEGIFGKGNPNPDLARDRQTLATQIKKPFYVYHMGDLFTPGTQNFVFEPTTELTPLETIWGNAFLRRPNTFRATQPPQIYADYQKYLNGIGGLVAGQVALQPLTSVQR